MTTLVALLVLAAALAHATWNAMIKGRGGDPLAATVGLCAAWAVIGLPLLPLVPAPHPDAWPYLGASVTVHLGYTAMLAAAYKKGDLSFVYPIARGVPPLLVVMAAWPAAAERPTLAGLGGVAMVALGVIAIGARRPSPGDGPRWRPLLLALAIAVAIATYTTIDGVGVRASGTAVGYIVWLSTIQGALFAASALWLGAPEMRREVWRRRWTGVTAGVLAAAGYGAVLWAMTQAPIGLVAALRETSVVFAAILGATFLGEPLGRRRVAAAGLVALGVAVMRLAA